MTGRLFAVSVTVALLGLCGFGLAHQGPQATKSPDAPEAQPAGSKPAPFDESKGYLHKKSGVGFIYPEGWDRLGVVARGPVTHLGLSKDKGDIEATLYWTELAGNVNPAAIGSQELAALRPIYREKVGTPEPATIAGRRGYKLAIAGGPLGSDAPDLAGVVYVFAVRRSEQTWKIKLRATVRGKEKLAAVEKLLGYYRCD
jgi:hypothetical protein